MVLCSIVSSANQLFLFSRKALQKAHRKALHVLNWFALFAVILLLVNFVFYLPLFREPGARDGDLASMSFG